MPKALPFLAVPMQGTASAVCVPLPAYARHCLSLRSLCKALPLPCVLHDPRACRSVPTLPACRSRCFPLAAPVHDTALDHCPRSCSSVHEVVHEVVQTGRVEAVPYPGGANPCNCTASALCCHRPRTCSSVSLLQLQSEVQTMTNMPTMCRRCLQLQPLWATLLQL